MAVYRERVTIVDLTELAKDMLHAKFQNHRPSGSVLENIFKEFCYL